MKWVGLSIATVLMVTVWGVFFTVFIQGEEHATSQAESDSEGTVTVESSSDLLDENFQEDEMSGEFISEEQSLELKDMKSDVNVTMDSSLDSERESVNQTADAKPSKVKNGDAVGYGDGVSIDYLLQQIPRK